MKKATKILLSSLCLCPLLLLAGCSKVNYYSISAAPSEAMFGSISEFHQEKYAEGSRVTLTAVEHSPSNPLIAWVKDGSYEIVKRASDTDKSLSLVTSAETEGHYIAVFAESEQTMMFAYVNDISVTLNGSPIEEFEYKLEYAIMNYDSEYFMPFEDKFGEDVKTNVLYFGQFGQYGKGREFQFKISVTIVDDSTTPPSSHTAIVNTPIISKANFADNSNIILDVDIDNSGENDQINIQLKKMGLELIQTPTE